MEDYVMKERIKALLYIPIWFYSNIFQLTPYFEFNSLYIPIWFYSNEDGTKLSSFGLLLYIPIWFYSNLEAGI